MSMLGKPAPKVNLPSFWSDQFDSRIQYVGHAELSDRVEIEGRPEDGAFTANYLRGDRLVAVLTVDQPRTIAAAGRTIEETHREVPMTKGNQNDV